MNQSDSRLLVSFRGNSEHQHPIRNNAPYFCKRQSQPGDPDLQLASNILKCVQLSSDHAGDSKAHLLGCVMINNPLPDRIIRLNEKERHQTNSPKLERLTITGAIQVCTVFP